MFYSLQRLIKRISGRWPFTFEEYQTSKLTFKLNFYARKCEASGRVPPIGKRQVVDTWWTSQKTFIAWCVSSSVGLGFLP